jgi:predicted chitinase
MKFHTGVVENRIDPLNLGRCQVRVVGLHTHDKTQLPTEDLPWAFPMQSITSASMNGIGHTPIGPVEGTSVIIVFADEDLQQPIMMGTIGGISSAPGIIDELNTAPTTSSKTSDIRLRTIAGPVTGNRLTFVDNVSGSKNLTGNLKPNMKVLGYDIPKETFIVSINSGTQITISNTVTSYGENIISFDSAPTNLNAVTKSAEQGFLVDSSGQPVLSGSGDPVTTGSSPSASNSTIPTVPPEKSTRDPKISSDGIKALIAACDKVGLTTKEQKCALLGIAGGESRWIPQLESFNYTPNRMKQIYSFATESDIERYSNASKKGLTRKEFFSWAYGPTKRGKGFLGNLTDEDGGKYFGRGFIQLTGKANYERYQKLANATGLNLDIVNNPDSLDSDINVSALVAALYIKDRVKGVNPNAHPDFFLAAKKAVGVNSPDIAAIKQNYYEYFYGKPGSGGQEKDASAPIPEPPKDNDFTTPKPSQQSIDSGSSTLGFRDPNNKYPLKSYIGEADTNRLARGVIEGTVVTKKDSTRVIGVPKALMQGDWDQPKAPFGAKYPFNKVFESESGHIQEWDDTPGQERTHTFHRAGTYTEVDPNGTQVNYIVGDNFILMERNGCVHVSGECNITVDGNTNIYARSDANIQVDQNATVEVGNNLHIGVATDTTIAVGGDMKIKVLGNLDIAAANITNRSLGFINNQAIGDFNIKSDNYNQTAIGNSNIKANALNQESVADMNIKSDNYNQTASGSSNIKANALNQESSSQMNIKSGGAMNVDYSQGNFGNGAGGASEAASAEEAVDIEEFELVPPPLGEPLLAIVPFLVPPERQFEERTTAETPDDFETPEGRAVSAEQARTEGVVGAPAPVAAEEAPAASGGAGDRIPVDCKIIYNTNNFTNDYRLSKNFTLGMLIDGGVNGRHKLVDQLLRDSKDSPERIFTRQEIVCNLAHVAQNILEPMLQILPGGIGGHRTQWRINSGYRLKGVVPNESSVSDHCKGRAVDIGLIIPDKYNKTYQLIQQAEKVIAYDQLILEYRFPDSVWIHASFNSTSGRKMAFTMVNDKTYKRNSSGVPEGYVLVENIPPKRA